MTDLNELLYFVQVCDAKSFTVAAKLLKVPKSKVSNAIARLENRLDVRLLERATRRVVLTEEGTTFLEYCRRAMDEAQRAELALRALGADPRGRLRIAAPVMFVHSFLGGLLGEFLRRYPELRLHLTVHAEPVNLNPLHANLDVVIQTGPIEDPGLVVKPLGLGRRGIYASPAYLKKHGSPDSPSSLRNHSCLTGEESGAGATWRLRGKAGVVEEVHLEPHVSVADPIVRQQFALAGLGIALLPEFIARPLEQQGCLVRVLRDWEAEGVNLFALYPSLLSQSPKVRVFLEWLDERVPSRLAEDSSTRAKPEVVPRGRANVPRHRRLKITGRRKVSNPG